MSFLLASRVVRSLTSSKASLVGAKRVTARLPDTVFINPAVVRALTRVVNLQSRRTCVTFSIVITPLLGSVLYIYTRKGAERFSNQFFQDKVLF